jgi:hypothetical protein
MIRWEIKSSVEQLINTGLSPKEAIEQILIKLNINDIVDPILWYQQTIAGE